MNMVVLHAYFDLTNLSIISITSGVISLAMNGKTQRLPDFQTMQNLGNAEPSCDKPSGRTSADQDQYSMQSIHIMAYIAGIIINRMEKGGE
jgi:hypothetical protein